MPIKSDLLRMAARMRVTRLTFQSHLRYVGVGEFLVVKTYIRELVEVETVAKCSLNDIFITHTGGGSETREVTEVALLANSWL